MAADGDGGGGGPPTAAQLAQPLQPPPSPAAVAKDKRRRMLLIFAGAGGACLSLRVLAAKLVVSWGGGAGEELLQCIQMLLLYHPSRYEDDLDFQPQFEHFQMIAKQKIFYRLDKVNYAFGRKKELLQQAMLIHPDGPAADGGLWVVFGGNAMLASDWFSFCWHLLRNLPDDSPKPAFLLVDYPGYGSNDGSPSPTSVLASSLAAVRAAYGRLASPKPAELHLLGHSLGSSASTQLAANLLSEAKASSPDDPLAQLRPGRLVLSAPFTSMEGMAQRLLSYGTQQMPLWAMRPLVSHKWDSEKWIPQAAATGWKIGIVHGRSDSLVPCSMGRALEKAAQKAIQQAPVETRGQVTFKEIKGAGHNDVMGHVKEYAILMGFSPADAMA